MQDGTADPVILFYRDDTPIGKFTFITTYDKSPFMLAFDVPSAGAHTYRVAVDRASASGLFVCYYYKLLVVEIG